MQVLSSDIQYSQKTCCNTAQDNRHMDMSKTDDVSAPAHQKTDQIELSQAGKEKHQSEKAEGKNTSQKTLTEEEETEVQELKSRDQEVRTHEQAHVAAGGQYVTGGPTYEFEKGPDGKRYATGGHVNIDTSEIADDPQATIEKAQVVKRAAMAPANPSDADRAVAAKASQMEQQARQELNSTESDKGEKDNIKTALSNQSTAYQKAPSSAGEILDISA